MFYAINIELNWIVRGSLEDATYLCSRPKSFWKVDFLYMSSTISNQWPPAEANIDPKAKLWTILLEVHKRMLHTKYLSSRPNSSWKEDFFKVFLYKSLQNQVTQGQLFEWSCLKFTRGCYTSKLNALWFLRKRFLKLFSYWLPWPTDISMDFNFFYHYGRVPPHKDHFCKVCL